MKPFHTLACGKNSNNKRFTAPSLFAGAKRSAAIFAVGENGRRWASGKDSPLDLACLAAGEDGEDMKRKHNPF